MSEPIPRVVFDDLVADFTATMETTIRNFRVARAEAWVDLWVHDEDPVLSLLSLAEAARAGGLPALEIVVGPAWAAKIDGARLNRALEAVGSLVTEGLAGGLLLRLAPGAGARGPGASPAAPARRGARGAAGRFGPAVVPEDSDAPYRIAAAGILLIPVHEGPLQASPGRVPVSASEGPLRLELAVDPASHRVVAAAHAGGRDELTRAALEALCAGAVGCPIQEVSDHGPLRAWTRLRAPDLAPPVPGVAAPENVHPAFRPLVALVRKALAAYRGQGGPASRDNRYEPAGDPAWRGLGAAGQQARVQAELEPLCRALELPDARCEAVTGGGAVTLVFAGPIPSRDGGKLMQLERWLREILDPVIYLQVGEMKDLSPIRRL